MKDKELKTVFRWVMSLAVITILFIPAVAVYEIEGRTETHILAVEGLYANGTVFNPYEPVDKTQIASLYNIQTVNYNANNNDSYYAKKLSTVGFHMAYTNFVTYTGNGTYAITPNYTIQPLIPTAFWLEIGIPLNVTTHELAQFDFIRLYSNSEHGFIDLFYDSIGGGTHVYFTEIRNNTYMLIMDLSLRTNLLSAPDKPVYILYTGIDKTDVTFTQKVETYTLEGADVLTWDDKQLYIVALLIVGAILTPLAIFSSKVIDIKIDKGKPGGNR